MNHPIDIRPNGQVVYAGQTICGGCGRNYTFHDWAMGAIPICPTGRTS